MGPRSLIYVASLLGAVLAQTQQAQFNQVINLNGDMNLNSITFPDGSRIETFSQSQRQLLVNQNQSPLPGNQVTGSTGQPFIALSQSSVVIQTNTATDLVGGQIELPINQQQLQSLGINMDNTFVAKLSSDRMSWMIMETIKSVNGTDNTVRIQKMNMIDGEYIALGRQTQVTSLALQQFTSITSQAFIVNGSGIQETEFIDGFRMSVRSSNPMIINANVVNGIATTMLSALSPGTNSINNFRYQVQTNLAGVLPNINRMVAVVQLPINPVRLQTIATQMGATANSNIRLSIAQRGILINPGGGVATSGTTAKREESGSESNSTSTSNRSSSSSRTSSGSSSSSSSSTFLSQATSLNSGSSTTNGNPVASQLLLSPTFTPIAANAVLDTMNGRLAIPVTQLDGDFIITVQMANGVGTTGTTGTTGTGGTTAGTTGTTGTGTIAGQEPAGVAGTTLPGSAETAGTIGTEPATAGTNGATGITGTTGTLDKRQIIAPGALAGLASSEASQSSSAAPQVASPAPAVATTAASAVPAAAPQTPAVAPAAAPAVQQPPASAGVSDSQGGVTIPMAWVNMMAQIATQGLPVDVDQLMSELAAQQDQTTTGTSALLDSSDIGAGLLARRWVA